LSITADKKSEAVKRLRTLEGQVRGLEKMVESERYCIDVLVQIAAAQEALRGVGKIIMRNYLENCATNSIRSQDEGQRQATYDELMDVIYKFAR